MDSVRSLHRVISSVGLQSASGKALAQIDEYIAAHDVRGMLPLAQAASDVLDGGVVLCQMDDLRRRRLLRVVPYSPSMRVSDIGADDECGHGGGYTFALTALAIRRFWPSRILAEALRKPAASSNV